MSTILVSVTQKQFEQYICPCLRVGKLYDFSACVARDELDPIQWFFRILMLLANLPSSG